MRLSTKKHVVNSLVYKVEGPKDLLAEFYERGFLNWRPLEQKIVAMFLSLISFISCYSSENLCNNDMDCPSHLVCREKRCVGLYENVDISHFSDGSASTDWGSYELVEVYSDEWEEEGTDVMALDIDELGDGTDVVALDIYEPLDVHQYEDINVIVDVMIEECKADEDCIKNECTGAYCIDGRCSNLYVRDGFCFINGACYGDGDVSPDNGCAICRSEQNSTDWSNNDGGRCIGDDRECTDDICINRTCQHPPKQGGERCKGGFCDGSGDCVECLRDQDCVSDNLDMRCESLLCDISQHVCKYERRPNGVGCAEWSKYDECYICLDGRCVCNSNSFQCDTCTPSCGYLKGDSCCSTNSSCGVRELDKTYDCERCCIGECIPY